MIKKKNILFILLLLFFSTKELVANTKIIVVVDNEIITNYDIKKESNYIKILNPSFNQLDVDQRFNIAKNYLINQIIKKKETSKFTNSKINANTTDQYLIDLFAKLDIENELEFERLLNLEDNYSIQEIKEKINIELLWNELIYSIYGNQVKIDKEKITKKINELQNLKKKEFLLSEIIFTKKNNLSFEEQLSEIKLSIQEIGFENTANIFSISESAQFGGKLGWVNEISLANNISKMLKEKKIGEYTDVIKLNNFFLILKINDVRFENLNINKDLEIKKLIELETNSQLTKFSKIYFDKIKLNYLINEK